MARVHCAPAMRGWLRRPSCSWHARSLRQRFRRWRMERPSPGAYGEFACQPQHVLHARAVEVRRRPDDERLRLSQRKFVVAGLCCGLADMGHTTAPVKRVTVALFDDGALTDHVELRNQLWTNEAELHGKPGVDDDGNGYIDDIHGWDFVDDDANVSPEGACVGRASHGTFMARPHRRRAQQRRGYRRCGVRMARA